MVEVPTWLIFSGVVLILFILLAVYLQFFSSGLYSPLNENSDSTYAPTISWGAVSVVSGSECYGYQFPVTQNGLFLNLGAPTLNTQVLDNYEDYGVTQGDWFSCLDSDRLNAIKVQHTCSTVPQGRDPATLGSGCYNLQGEIVPYNSTEVFYQTCRGNAISTKASYCPGQVAGVSVAFQADGISDIPCMVWNPDNTISVTAPNGCNLGDPSQQFRVIRTTPGVYPSPSPTQGNQGNNGFLAAIVERQSGLCVMPTTNTPQSGDSLVLRDCTDNNFGYVWALIPPITYTKADGPAAQQITYVGAATPQDFSKLTIHNPSDLYDFLVSINALSMKNVDGTLLLRPYTQEGPLTPNSDAEDFNAQYASFLLYNIIVNQDTLTPF